MAGICGFLGDIGTRRLLEKMSAAIGHRGKESVLETISDAGVSQRLPMYKQYRARFSKDGENVLVCFDGDIFNKDEIIQMLGRAGINVETHDDTEVVFRLYTTYGKKFPRFINGNFALAITDGATLYIARDELGIRPLYYCFNDRTLLFGSEMKTILQAVKNPALNAISMYQRHIFRDHCIGDSTYIHGIKHVLPGTYVFHAARTACIEKEPFGTYAWNIPQSEDDLKKVVAETVERNVRYYTQTNGTLGILLSGGFDSSILATLVTLTGNRPLTFTLSDDPRFPDIAAANLVARHLRTRHKRIITDGGFKSTEWVDGIRTYEDPVFRHTLYKLAEAVHHAGGVDIAMSGAGADLLGMPLLAGENPDVFSSPRYQNAHTFIPAQVEGKEELLRYLHTLTDAVVRKKPDGVFFEHFARDYLPQQLFPSSERALMRFGIEPAFPFADTKIRDIGRALPKHDKYGKNEEKSFLRSAFSYLRLPAEIHSRAKVCSKGNLAFTKHNYSAFMSGALTKKYCEKHPYGELLGHDPYLIACFDCFSHIFLKHKGLKPSFSPSHIFDTSLWNMATTRNAFAQALFGDKQFLPARDLKVKAGTRRS